MSQKICYQFNDFKLDPERLQLLHHGNPVSITPKPLQLLLILVSNHGQIVDRTELIKQVWGNAVVTINNFDVTLRAVRRALGDSGHQPTYIRKVGDGYRFIGEVQELSAVGCNVSVAKEFTDEDSRGVEEAAPSFQAFKTQDTGETPSVQEQAPSISDPTTVKISLPVLPVAAQETLSYWPHIVAASTLYGLLYAIALVLEISYEFDRYGSSALAISPLVFLWMTLSSIGGFALDRRLTGAGRPGGLVIVVAVFFVALALLLTALSFFLPSRPVTQSTLQAYPAQAAYLKDASYFVLLAFLFLILPIHFVLTAEREIRQKKFDQVFALITANKWSPAFRNTVYPRLWVLAVLLVVLAMASLIMTSRLLDHLKLSSYMNLFTQLVYFRAIVYFSLGIECLIWYYQALSKLQIASQRC